MTTLRAAPPRPERPTRAAAPDPPAPPARIPLRPRPSAPRDRLDRWSAAGSIALHLLLLGSVVLLRDRLLPTPVPTTGPAAAERVEYLDLADFPAGGGAPAGGAALALPLPPLPGEQPTTAGAVPDRVLGRFPSQAPSGIRAPSASGGAPSGGAGAAPSGRGGVREALRPGYRDGRLYVDPGALRVEVQKSQHQQYMEHLQARVDAINDSIYGESARAQSATDWTRTDKEGRRWGLSPEGLHLGGVTVPRALIPLPGATGDNTRLQEQRDQVRAREEIQRQEDDRARRKAQEEAIRRTREREAAKKAGSGG